MTQEEKQLLLKDLCARLPYGVKVRLIYDENTIEVREMGIGSLHDILFNNAEGVPYLRPMSSMTEEETLEFVKTIINTPDGYPMWTTDSYDWLNKNHFDYRGLIPMKLALEAPEGMYETK